MKIIFLREKIKIPVNLREDWGLGIGYWLLDLFSDRFSNHQSPNHPITNHQSLFK
jgi:hypothetical protein